MQRQAHEDTHRPANGFARLIVPACIGAIVCNAALAGMLYGAQGAGIAAASSLLPSILLIVISRLLQIELQSERKHSISALAASRAFLVRILDAIPATVFMKDTNSRYIFVNDAFCELRAMTREEILAAPLSKMRDEHGRTTESEEEDREVFRGRTILKEERVFNPDSGQEIFRTVSKRLCHDDSGRALVIGSTHNVSMWRQAEREAQAMGEKHLRQYHFLKFVLNTIPIPVYVKDEELYYLMVNQAFIDLIGLPEDQIVGHRANELICSDATLADEMQEMSMLARADSHLQAESRVLTDAQGRARPVMIRKIVGRNADGNQVIVGTYTDKPDPRDTGKRPEQGDMTYPANAASQAKPVPA